MVEKGLEDIHNDVRRVLEAFEELKKTFSEPTLEQLALAAVRVLRSTEL